MCNIDYGDSFDADFRQLFEIPMALLRKCAIQLVKCEMHGVDCSQTPLPPADSSELENLLESVGEDSETNTLTITIVHERGKNAFDRMYSVLLKSIRPDGTSIVVNDVIRHKLTELLAKNSPRTPAHLQVPPEPESSLANLPRLASPAIGGTLRARVVHAASPIELYVMLHRDETEFGNIANRVSFYCFH